MFSNSHINNWPNIQMMYDWMLHIEYIFASSYVALANFLIISYTNTKNSTVEKLWFKNICVIYLLVNLILDHNIIIRNKIL